MTNLSFHNLTTNWTPTHNQKLLLGLGLNHIFPKPLHSHSTILREFDNFSQHLYKRVNSTISFTTQQTIPSHQDNVTRAFHRLKNTYPSNNSIPTNTNNPIFAPIKSYLSQVKIRLHDKLLSTNTNPSFTKKQTHSFLYFKYQHHLIINTTINSLKNNKSITIKPTDKNLGLCVMDSTWYHNQCLAHLQDTSTYQAIQFPTDSSWLLQKFLPLINTLSQHKKLYASTPNSNPQLSSLAKFLLNPLLSTNPSILNHLHPFSYIPTLQLFRHCIPNSPQLPPRPSQSFPNPLSIPFANVPNTTHNDYQPINSNNFLLVLSTPLPLEQSLKIPTAKFYVIPKVHKSPISTRPIANAIPSLTTPCSQLLDQILRPLMLIQESFIYSSHQLISSLQKISLNRSQPPPCLAEADVVSMYPSIDLNHGLHNINGLLIKHSIPNRKFIIQLLHWVLHNNFLVYKNHLYLQIKGVAMGTNVAVTFSCLYLATLESQAYSNLLNSNLPNFRPPILLRRFIDDIASIWHSPRDAQIYFNELNNLHPNIQLTYLLSPDSIKFLDIIIFNPSTSNSYLSNTYYLSTKIFQKEHCLYQYLPASSFHPPNAKYSWILSDANRYCLNSSSYQDFSTTLSLFKQRLQARGYNADFLHKTFLHLPTCPTTYQQYRNTLLNSRIKPLPQVSSLSDLEILIASKKSKSIPIIYKTVYNPVLQHLKLPDLLSYTTDLHYFQFFKEFFQDRHHPILCYINSKSIRRLLCNS